MPFVSCSKRPSTSVLQVGPCRWLDPWCSGHPFSIPLFGAAKVCSAGVTSHRTCVTAVALPQGAPSPLLVLLLLSLSPIKSSPSSRDTLAFLPRSSGLGTGGNGSLSTPSAQRQEHKCLESCSRGQGTQRGDTGIAPRGAPLCSVMVRGGVRVACVLSVAGGAVATGPWWSPCTWAQGLCDQMDVWDLTWSCTLGHLRT